MSAPEDLARLLDAGTPKGPRTLEIYPTMRCNLRCGFCDATLREGPTPGELPMARWREIVEEAAAAGARRVFVLGGGEPLAAPGLLDLLGHVKALGLEGVLGTNGTLLGPERVRRLVDMGWDEIHLSLDAPEAAVHDRLRGRDGAFQATLQALCRLDRARRSKGAAVPRLVIHFVVTAPNRRLLAPMVRLAADFGVDRVDFDALVAWREEHRPLVLGEAERRELSEDAARAAELALRLGVSTTLGALLDPNAADRTVSRLTIPARAHPVVGRAPCLRAWTWLVVQPNGRTSPCCVLAGTGDSLAAGPLSAVWERGPALTAHRRAMAAGEPPRRCAECSANILQSEAALRALLDRPAGGPTPWT